MSARTVYSSSDRMHVVQVTLDPDEAENVAYALGLEDGGARELLAAAASARAKNEEGDDDDD